MSYLNLFLILFLCSTLQAAQYSGSQPLLIFLDDYETNLGAIVIAFMTAYAQEDAPMLVSASLISVALETEKKYRHMPFTERVKHYMQLKAEEEIRNFFLALVPFIKESDKWIFKEVNPSLYLLIPKKYLNDKKIKNLDVMRSQATGSATPTELALGLKVNHMRMVRAVDIKKPLPAASSAAYFTNYLSDIFVLNSEYLEIKEAERKSITIPKNIPAWSLYITGHGSALLSVIAHCTLDQFKVLLAFLETKITTRALIYASCYAAGRNVRDMYKHAQSGVDRTYPFTIIVMALTDAGVYLGFEVQINAAGKVKYERYFTEFIRQITAPGVVDYMQALGLIVKKGLMNLPQIKYPGLPWFSVVDTDQRVINIDSIMAKTRTQPLNVATFFARKGVKAHPEGILLYTTKVSFDIIWDVSNNPKFVSMLPGNAIHELRKISVISQDVDELIKGFFIENIYPRKVFVIDALEGRFSSGLSKVIGVEKGMLLNVFISVREKIGSISFFYKGQMYVGKSVDQLKIATKEEQKTYTDFIGAYRSGAFFPDFKQAENNPLLTPEAADKIQEAQEKKVTTIEIKKSLANLHNNLHRLGTVLV